MARIFLDRVMESSTSTGVGPLTLDGPITGYQSFAGVGNGNTCYACCYAVDAQGSPTGDWEVFLGTWATGGILSRTQFLDSSTGAPIDFPAGSKRVMLVLAAATPLALSDASNVFTEPQTINSTLLVQDTPNEHSVFLRGDPAGVGGLVYGYPGLLVRSVDTLLTLDNGQISMAPNGIATTVFSNSGMATTGQAIITANGAAVTPLIAKGAASQSASLQEWRDSTGTALASVGPAGTLVVNRSLLVHDESGYYPIEVRHNGSSIFHVAPLTGEVFASGEFNTASGVRVSAFGAYIGVLGYCRFVFNGGGITAYPGAAGNIGLSIRGEVGQTANLQEWQDSVGTPLVSVSAGGDLLLGRASSITSRTLGSTVGSWVDNTDATRKAQVIQYVYDTAAREVLRMEADGVNPRIGFLGASAVARPVVTGSTGGNAALQSLVAALALLGLVTDSTTP